MPLHFSLLTGQFFTFKFKSENNIIDVYLFSLFMYHICWILLIESTNSGCTSLLLQLSWWIANSSISSLHG